MIKNLTPPIPNKPINGFEVHPCKTIKKGKKGKKDIVEQCDEKDAEFWSVYVHYNEGGLDCVADCDTEKEANELADLIEGIAKSYLN